MDWRTIIKEKREENPNRHNRAPERRKPQTKLVGGKNPRLDKDTGNPFEETDEERRERQELLEATRSDLMDKVMDVIGSYSDEQLIELLMGTQGKIEVGAIQVRDNR